MQIHELFQRPKKVNEDLASFFGLNNPTVAQAWSQIGGELMQNLSSRFAKDPKYANMSLTQRKQAMLADQMIQQTAQQKVEEWQKVVTALETKNRGVPLTDQQYEAAFMNWANKSLFNGKFSTLDPSVKAKAQQYFGQFVAHRNDSDAAKRSTMQQGVLASLLADESARAVQVATDLQKAQAAMGIQGQAQQPQVQQGPGYTVQPTQPGYKATTTNAPVATLPQTTSPVVQSTAPVAPRTVVPGTQQKQLPGYGATKTNAPTTVPQIKPADVKKIASNVAKAPA